MRSAKDPADLANENGEIIIGFARGKNRNGDQGQGNSNKYFTQKISPEYIYKNWMNLISLKNAAKIKSHTDPSHRMMHAILFVLYFLFFCFIILGTPVF